MYVFITIIMTIIGFCSGLIFVCKLVVQPSFEQIRKLREESSKHLDLYMLMNDWVRVKQKGSKVSQYFEDNGYKRIAIYGMNYVGETLVNELKNTNIEVVVGIDKNANNMSSDVKLVTVDEFKEEIDAVIVTPITFFDIIAENLENKVKCPIISIEDVIYEVGN